jgi:hypothetical protein
MRKQGIKLFYRPPGPVRTNVALWALPTSLRRTECPTILRGALPSPRELAVLWADEKKKIVGNNLFRGNGRGPLHAPPIVPVDGRTIVKAIKLS